MDWLVTIGVFCVGAACFAWLISLAADFDRAHRAGAVKLGQGRDDD